MRILGLENRLVEAREEMRFKASHDALTMLWNRAVILESLSVNCSCRIGECRTSYLCDAIDFTLERFQDHGAVPKHCKRVMRGLESHSLPALRPAGFRDQGSAIPCASALSVPRGRRVSLIVIGPRLQTRYDIFLASFEVISTI